MCAGVTIGLQWNQLSASINIMGAAIKTIRVIIIVRNKVILSLIYQFVKTIPTPFPTGELLTYSCRTYKCTKMTANTNNGNKKCKVKKRLRQAPPREKPPHTITTISLP